MVLIILLRSFPIITPDQFIQTTPQSVGPKFSVEQMNYRLPSINTFNLLRNTSSKEDGVLDLSYFDFPHENS